MDRLKQVISGLKHAIKEELNGVTKLSGSKYEKFLELFNLEGDPDIYFTPYNLIILDKDVVERLNMFCREKHKILELEAPQYNSCIWIYSHFNEPVFEGLLTKD